MSELKTLNDMEENVKGIVDDEGKEIEIYAGFTKEQLKKEAIKRIKFLNTGGFSFKFDFDGKVEQYFKKKEKMMLLDWVNLGACIELINFFNLSEEDLK
jgi:hypothetical protein